MPLYTTVFVHHTLNVICYTLTYIIELYVMIYLQIFVEYNAYTLWINYLYYVS